MIGNPGNQIHAAMHRVQLKEGGQVIYFLLRVLRVTSRLKLELLGAR